MKRKRKRRSPSAPVKRTYGPAKKLFGKLTGDFMFGAKLAEDKARQMKLKL